MISTTAIGAYHLPGYQEVLYYQAILSGTDDVIISTDTNFIIKTWNTAAEKIYKKSAVQVIGKKTADIIQQEYINTTREEVTKKVIKNNFWKGIIKVVNNNEPVFLQTSYNAVRDIDGIKIGYISVSKNVTDEINTKKSLQNISGILAQLEESFLIVDTNYQVTFLQPKNNVQSFFKSDYQLGDDALKYIPDAYQEEVKACYERAFNGETVNYDSVSEAEPKLYFNVTYAPLKDDFGNINRVCVIIKDFTAQKEFDLLHQKKASVEKKLYESRKLFENFMQNSPLPVSVIDDKGFIHYINSAYAKAYGLTKEASGKNVFEVYSKELAQYFFEDNKKVIATGTPIETVEPSNSPENKADYKVIKFPIHYKGKTMIASWAIDITAQVEALENLSILNEHKNRLVSLIAHDLRGPLGMNVSFLRSIVDDYYGYTSEELITSLRLITKSSENCFDLIDELLLWARNQLNGTTYNPALLNLQTIILKIVDNLWELAQRKNIQLKTNFDYCSEVFIDYDMFAIVLRNLITNAIKFSFEEGIIEIETEMFGDEVKVSVRDFGTGMSQELVQKLMYKLNHESTYGTSGEKGTGLGLFMTKDYIEENGGRLGIESTPGEGSTFYFTVPVNSSYIVTTQQPAF